MTGFKQTEIGTLPEDWEVREIKDLVLDAKTRNPQKEPTKKIKYIDVSSVSNQTFSVISYQDYLGKDAPGRARKVVYTNDVIFATVRPTLKRVAKISQEYNGEYCSTAFCVLRADKNKLDFEFLYQYLLTNFFVKEIAKYQSGASYPAVRDDDVKKTKMPYPPLNEQCNIAKILSIIQSAIETQEKIIQTTTELKKALMQKLFTEGLHGEPQRKDSAPKWDKVKLGSLAEKGIVEFQNGFSCGQWNESGVGIPQLRPFNVTDSGKIDLTQIKSIETNKSVEKYKLKQNDIVFNNTNSEELVGKTALWQNGDGYVLSNHMTIIRIKDNTSINPTYLANFLHKKWFDGHYKMVCRRHVNQASVSIERLKDMDLPYPPIDVQDEIAKVLSVIDEKTEQASRKKQTLQSLFKSKIHHLMTGQIRVKDLRFS